MKGRTVSRAIILLYCLILTLPAFGQETADLPFHVPAPERWAKETIPLPPDFATDMQWKGIEELCFAPHWMKADSATFFSYALLFWLPGEQQVDAKILEAQLLTYYRGLAKAVSESKEKAIAVADFTMDVKADSTKSLKRESGEAVTVFAGDLKWIEPFTTGKSQNLHMDIHTWRSAMPVGRCVFICASPQPDTAAVWKSLREIREGTRPRTGSESANDGKDQKPE